MDRSLVEKSHGILQQLIGNWDSLDRRLFDNPSGKERVNLRAYLDEMKDSIAHHFSILRYALDFYGSAARYLGMRKGELDDRNQTDYFCSENIIIAFRKAALCHLKLQEIEDMERLLRHYLADTMQQTAEATPPQTA